MQASGVNRVQVVDNQAGFAKAATSNFDPPGTKRPEYPA